MDNGADCLYASFLDYKNIEPLYDEFAGLWKELETLETIHLSTSLDVKAKEDSITIYITLQEPGYNHFKVTIVTYLPDNMKIVHSGIAWIEEARILSKVDGYSAFVEANYLITSTAKNNSIADNWYRILDFTENTLKRYARVCKISHILKCL